MYIWLSLLNEVVHSLPCVNVQFRIQTLTSLSQARHRRERHTVVPEIGEVISERLKTRLVEEKE